MNKRKSSIGYYIKRYWIVTLFWCIVALTLFSVSSYSLSLYEKLNHNRVVIKEHKPFKFYVPNVSQIAKVPKAVVKVPKVKTKDPEASKGKGHKHFSRGSYTERKVSIRSSYTKADVKILASILETECPSEIPNWDRRLEANVILNRHKHYGGTLKSIIEAGNGSQFNGIRSKSYKNRKYSQESYDAAYAVLIKGERVLDKDIMYFANIYIAKDKRFVNSINWVLKQNSKYGHSFGKLK
jgi:hypothetical protein